MNEITSTLGEFADFKRENPDFKRVKEDYRALREHMSALEESGLLGWGGDGE